MSVKREVDVELGVTIEINDPSALTRVLENEDGWQEMYYTLKTEDDVLRHWAYNAVANGVEQVNKLDGWADLADDAVTFRLNGYSESHVWRRDE